MPVPAQTTLFNESTANGVTTVFPYEFMISAAGDITVELDGVVTTTGFTLTGVGEEGGGTIVFSTAPANGVVVLRYLDSELSRATDYQQLGDFNADTVDQDFDRLWLAMQSLALKLGLCVRAPISSASGGVLPEPVANNVIGWNSEANGFENYPPSDNTLLAVALGLPSGASMVGYLPAVSGAANRDVQTKLRESVSVTDTTTPALADANGGTLFVPADTSTTVVSGAALNAIYQGPGRITTADGNKRGKYFSAVKTAPSSLGNHNTVDQAFNGDLSKSHFQIEHRITGASTLGTPATGYMYTPETCASYTYLFNQSGWNQGTANNVGRTAAVAHRVVASNAGQGDAMCFNGSGFVMGTRAGSTHWLANPAVALFAGDCSAGSDGVYLNPYETVLSDNGFDVAAVGAVYNFNRTNAAGAKSTVWEGARYQNIGSVTCDAMISGSGKWFSGIDFTMGGLDFGAQKAAIALKPNDRIYFSAAAGASGNLEANWRATSSFGHYMTYDSATSKLLMVAGGAAILQIDNTSLTVAGNVNASTQINTGTQYQVSFTKVVGARETGYSAMTGTTNKATVYDTASVTLEQLAGRVMALQASLTTHGLIGA